MVHGPLGVNGQTATANVARATRSEQEPAPTLPHSMGVATAPETHSRGYTVPQCVQVGSSGVAGKKQTFAGHGIAFMYIGLLGVWGLYDVQRSSLLPVILSQSTIALVVGCLTLAILNSVSKLAEVAIVRFLKPRPFIQVSTCLIDLLSVVFHSLISLLKGSWSMT